MEVRVLPGPPRILCLVATAKERFDRAEGREKAANDIDRETREQEIHLAFVKENLGRARDCLKRAQEEARKTQERERDLQTRIAERPAQPPPSPPAAQPLPSPPPEGGASIAPVANMQPPCPFPAGRISVSLADADMAKGITRLGFLGTDTFIDLADIVRQLKAKVAPRYDPTGKCGRCIETLSIWGHGSTGGGYISFGNTDAQIGSHPVGYHFDAKLAQLGRLMCNGGKVIINQCDAGEGRRGKRALQELANKIGVPVSGPNSTIKACRGFGGLLTHYRKVKPDKKAKTPGQNKPRPVKAP